MNRISSCTRVVSILIFASALSAPPASAAPQQYASPAEAAAALMKAVDSDTTAAIAELFGPEAKEIVFSGDPVQDKNDFERFQQRVKELLAVSKLSETTATVVIGAEAWPFPIPLVKKDNHWLFDVPAGREAILDRRIGENELNAIKACKAYVKAQQAYASQDRDDDGVIEYAQRLISSPGTRDGLYWPSEEGEEESPLGEVFAAATAEGYEVPSGSEGDSALPSGFHGYRYKILTAQGESAPGGAYSYVQNGNMVTDFALVATPVKQGETGIMTFLVNSRGDIYQKNITDSATMDSYNPDDSWELVE